MTKIEITNLITKHLTKSPITLTDLLGEHIKLDSYEKYIHEFTLVKNTFADDISQFTEEAQRYLNKMSKFVSTCENSGNSENHITNNFEREICDSSYNSQITPKFISPNNLSGASGRSVQALKQINLELGEENLNYYIQLIKNPSNLSSYLSDSKKQKVAMHYILIVTNHHSPSRLKRDKSAQTLFQLTNSAINDSIKEITVEKNDYIKFMNQEKQSFDSWFSDTTTQSKQLLDENQQNYQQFLDESKVRFDDLEKTYSEKLKVEKPADFMKKKANGYMWQAIGWAAATLLLSISLMFLLGFILDPKIELSDNIFTIQLFSGNMSVYSSIIVLAIIALVIYVLKLFVKLTVSAKHLSEEYHQKYVLTYFYLALVKDGKLDNEQAKIILATLFTKADTGLIKNDSSLDLESLQKILLTSK